MRLSIFFLLLIFASISYGNDKVEEITLNADNTVTLRGDIDLGSIISVQTAILTLKSKQVHNPNDDIYLVIDSGGGVIDYGEALGSFIREDKHIVPIVLRAASEAAFLFVTSPRRLIVEDAILMFHRAAVTLKGQFNKGELESELDFLVRENILQNERIAKSLGISVEEYQNKVKDEWYLVGSKDILKNKAADKVVHVSCDRALLDRKEMGVITVNGKRIQAMFSGCPLVRLPLVIKADPTSLNNGDE